MWKLRRKNLWNIKNPKIYEISPQNGTWYHLSVHAAPKFVITPKDVVYVGIGDNIILPCQVDDDDDDDGDDDGDGYDENYISTVNSFN